MNDLDLKKEQRDFCASMRAELTQEKFPTIETDADILRLFSQQYAGWLRAKRAALAAPQRPPVAIVEFIDHSKHYGTHARLLTHLPNGTRLYAHAQQHEQIEDCKTCGNTGTFIARYSGREDDGNAPEFERCDCEHAFPKEPPPAAPALSNEEVQAIKAGIFALEIHGDGVVSEFSRKHLSALLAKAQA